MAKKIISYEFTITVAGGAGSTTNASSVPMTTWGGFIRQIILTAPSASDLFNVHILNQNGRAIYRRKNLEGELIENCEIPMKGTMTIVITSASTDGTYHGEIMFMESY